MSEHQLGVVVLGTGRAGQRRIADVEAASDLSLVAAVGRRSGGAALAAAIHHADCEAVIIATENASHAPLAETALRAGRHVLVEFPLCAYAIEAEQLLALARMQGRVLQLELIGLLTGGHVARQAACADPARGVDHVVVEFAGGSYRWVADEIRAGHVGQLCVGRLHALDDLLGPLTLERAALQPPGGAGGDAGGYRLEAQLRAADGRRATLRSERVEGGRRQTTWQLFDAAGAVVAVDAAEVAGPPGGLFAADLRRFVQRVHAQRARVPAPAAGWGRWPDDDAIVRVAALAEAISAAARG